VELTATTPSNVSFDQRQTSPIRVPHTGPSPPGWRRAAPAADRNPPSRPTRGRRPGIRPGSSARHFPGNSIARRLRRRQDLSLSRRSLVSLNRSPQHSDHTCANFSSPRDLQDYTPDENSPSHLNQIQVRRNPAGTPASPSRTAASTLPQASLPHLASPSARGAQSRARPDFLASSPPSEPITYFRTL